jgi:hypothetical protein
MLVIRTAGIYKLVFLGGERQIKDAEGYGSLKTITKLLNTDAKKKSTRMFSTLLRASLADGQSLAARAEMDTIVYTIKHIKCRSDEQLKKNLAFRCPNVSVMPLDAVPSIFPLRSTFV